jgi:hypothetical protein|tara:strand:+ start:2525 stop:3088 length:564 start_codon:yes stop_codon:yes gene_type:complete
MISCPGQTWQPYQDYSSKIPDSWRCNESATSNQLVKIPVFENAWQVVENCGEYPAEATAIAMIFFYYEWRKTFGDVTGEVESALRELMVEWSTARKTASAYDIGGVYIKDASVSGLAISKSVIWVKVRPGKLICNTSLVHELVHIAIWSHKKTGGDADHLGPKYTGWSVDHSMLIQKVNNQLCGLGI